MSTFLSSFVSVSERVLAVMALGGAGSKRRGVIPLIDNDRADWQLFISLFFFYGLSLPLFSLSAGEQDSVNSALDGGSGSDTICHLIHFQGRG